MDFLQGRSERNGEAYVFWYVELLSDTRTKQKTIFIGVTNTKALIPFVRYEGLTRFVVPPWFGEE